MKLNKTIFIAVLSTLLTLPVNVANIHGKTIQGKDLIVESQSSYEKDGYYTQTLKNGEKVVFSKVGVIYEKGIRYTYYSSNVLYHHKTPEWKLGKDGLYRDKDGYIIVASVDHAQGKIVNTPFGKGIVRDSGCPSGTIDIYCAF